MCPQASGAGGGGKGGAQPYKDHDTAFNIVSPPTINVWYPQMHDFNARVIWCCVFQVNDEAAAHSLQVRWTIDGNLYVVTIPAAANAAIYYIYRSIRPSGGGTDGLDYSATLFNAGYYVDKRGLDFLVEIQITDVPGTNQGIAAMVTYETS